MCAEELQGINKTKKNLLRKKKTTNNKSTESNYFITQTKRGKRVLAVRSLNLNWKLTFTELLIQYGDSIN